MQIFATILLLLVCTVQHRIVLADELIRAISSPDRPIQQKIRDEYRNPQQTLRFFDIQSHLTVVEISPGGGWYTNILAPMLSEKGKLYAAHFYINDDSHEYYRNARLKFEQKIASYPPYKNIELTAFDPINALTIAPRESVDRVLTFRNVHNWYMRYGDEGVADAFSAFFRVLAPGGILGVVEHRLPESADDGRQKDSGYMKQSYVVSAAEQAGFELLATSEINANASDTADHPNGVWTLPPILRLGDQNRDAYLAIGESDRMTLKFVKPEGFAK